MDKFKSKKYCIAAGCFNNDRNWSQFFSIPSTQKDSTRCEKWLLLLGREDLLKKLNEKELNVRSYYVCSAHFDPSSLKSIQKLTLDAVPTMNLESNQQPECTKFIESEGGTSYSTMPSTSEQIKDRVLVNDIETQTNGPEISEQQTQTAITLTEATPTNRKLSDELKEAKREQQRLTNEINKIQKELETKNQPITSNDPDDEIAGRFQKLIEWHNKIKNEYKRSRYDAEYKLFALNLHYSSPRAYRCLQTVLKLPSKSTLNRFKMTIAPKLDNRVLDTLAIKIKSLPEEAKYCTICVDEMPLQKNLYYNIKNDEVIGFHNVDGNVTPEIASHAYVIMLQGNHVKWKQPIAYALLATSKNYEDIDLWMNEIIGKLSAIGIKIKAIISDQGSNFDKFAKDVKKVTVEKPYFMYQDTKIYYIFDIPHLVKCIRNNLITSDYIFDGRKISWEHIVQLYNDQKERHLRLIPKVTDAHIYPNDSQKMRAKLATQIFSRAVAAALHTYIDLGKLTEDARPTAKFIETIDNLFDVLQSSKIKSNNKFQTAFRMSEDQKTVLHAAKKMFADIKAVHRKTRKNDTGHIETFLNFQISIQSFILLHEDLRNDGFKYILTRRLNQDNIENFFDSVRQQGRCCHEPTPIQFRRAFSKLFVCNMMKNSPFSNCEMDICDILVKAEDLSKMQFGGKLSVIKPEPSSVFLNGETDYRLDLPDDNTLTYVSGYLFFKCANKHNCPVMNQVFKTAPGLNDTNLFSKYKSYNKQSGFFGSLKMPPKEFIDYIQCLENTFVQHFEKVIQNTPGGKILELFQAVPAQTPCSCFPVDYLVKLYTRFRIYATIKYNNRQFKDGKKEITKYFKVKHL